MMNDKKTLFIGDVAGRKDELLSLIDQFHKHKKILLGDLQDRGSQSREVLDLISSRSDVVAIFGNHEELFLDFMENSFCTKWVTFLANGGIETLSSYLEEKEKESFLKIKEEIYLFFVTKYFGSYEFRYNHNFKHEDFLKSEFYKREEKRYIELTDLLERIRLNIDPKYLTLIKSLPLYMEGSDWVCSHAPLIGYPITQEITSDEYFLWNRFNSIQGIPKHQIYGHNARYKETIKDNGFISYCLDHSKNNELLGLDWETKKTHSIKYKD